MPHPGGSARDRRDRHELAANSRDAMPEGGQFTIETSMANSAEAPCEDGEQRVRLRISDTGCGMDDHTREHAFEPFFTTKGIGKGTGLGLSTVYGIVRQNNGEIQLSSAPGSGTTFDLYFPAETGKEAESETGVARQPRAKAAGTILVAEDEPALRGLVKETLEQSGYNVMEVTDGYDAVRIIEEHAVDIHLLLTDVIMPLMNGHELASRLKALRPNTPVLYVRLHRRSARVPRHCLAGDRVHSKAVHARGTDCTGGGDVWGVEFTQIICAFYGRRRTRLCDTCAPPGVKVSE